MSIAEQQRRFSEWTGEHCAIVYRVVNGFAAGDDRNDLLQEVLLAIWKSIPSFRGQCKATTFLYRVCHNAALLWVRTQKNYRRRIELFSGNVPTSGGESDSLEEERLGRIYAAIHLLKPMDRSLMLMALDGLSYREMAEVLGLTESNIGVKINRIKTQLIETLKGDEYELR